MISKKKKHILFIIASLMACLFIAMLWGDLLTHGFYCEVKDYSFFKERCDIEYVDLSETTYRTTFSPTKDHFAGFEIVMSNITIDSRGEVQVSIFDSNNNLHEKFAIDISKIENDNWFIVKTQKEYKNGDRYTIIFDANSCNVAPYFQVIDADYLQDENLGNGLLIAYGYSEPTFSDSEKILFSIATVGVLVFAFGNLYLCDEKKVICNYVFIGVWLSVLLSWNYMFNSFDQENQNAFYEFQDDSDLLVMSTIIAEKNGVFLDKYGLGTYYSLVSLHRPWWKFEFYSDEDWEDGYNKTSSQILIEDNGVTKKIVDEAKIIRFENGDQVSIISKWGNGKVFALAIDTECPLSSCKFGELSEANFYDENGCEISTGYLEPYKSQYGLQGRFFRHLARRISIEKIEEYLWLICSISLAIVLALISLLLYKKYNLLMAGCFWFTFLLSPWIVNFSNSVYWVEVTWFLPMLIGLLCSIWINSKKIRIICYVSCFFAILIKSLCGYEYISSVMLGMIAFLLVDCALMIASKNKKGAYLYVRTIFIIGFIALVAFGSAICIHASLRGDGNIMMGVKSIINEDVLKRASGGDLNNFQKHFWPSLNSSAWDVLKRYYHFNTDVIAGIDANCFPLISILPLFFFVYNYLNKKTIKEDVALYIVLYITSVSWLILGKSHSYIHTHMNFVMWYMGYIQICFYIILKNIFSISRFR